MYKNNLIFCCRGVPDAIYHLSLTDSLIRSFPPDEPGAAGIIVKNYHFFSNLVVADLIRVFKLDLMPTQFQGMSLLVSLLLGLCALIIGDLLNLGRSFARWLAIFLYFSGDILYVLLFLRGKGLDFSVTILDDATKLLAGPPRAYSILVLLGGICLLLIWVKQKKFLALLLSGLLFGGLVGFKIYTGIFALTGFAALIFYEVLRRRFRVILPFLTSILISFSYYWLFTDHLGKFQFIGVWRFVDFSVNKNLSLTGLYYSWLSAVSKQKEFLVLLIEVVMILIYFIFLFGTINLGFIQTKKSLRFFPKELNIFLISGLAVSLILGSFFIQNPGNANTVQFMINAFILMAFYSALALYYWLKNCKLALKAITISFVVIFTCARPIHETYINLINISLHKGFVVSKSQLEALKFIKNELANDSILVVDRNTSNEETSMYIPFITQRTTLLVGTGILIDHGQNINKQKEILDQITDSMSPNLVEQYFNKNNLHYLYLAKGSSVFTFEKDHFLKEIFNEDGFRIYKVD